MLTLGYRAERDASCASSEHILPLFLAVNNHTRRSRKVADDHTRHPDTRLSDVDCTQQ